MKPFSILLHTNFRARARKTFRRYRELKPQAIAVLEALREGPGSGHVRVRYLRDPRAQGNVWRARVGRHRLIYRVYGQQRDVVPLFLSDRPRNEVTYQDWETIGDRVMDDYEEGYLEEFIIWRGEL